MALDYQRAARDTDPDIAMRFGESKNLWSAAWDEPADQPKATTATKSEHQMPGQPIESGQLVFCALPGFDGPRRAKTLTPFEKTTATEDGADNPGIRKTLATLQKAGFDVQLKYLDTPSKMYPGKRDETIAAATKDVQYLIEKADRAAETREGQRARFLYPDKDRLVHSTIPASKLAAAPASARMTAAWIFADLANSASTWNQALADKLQEKAFRYRQEALERTPDYLDSSTDASVTRRLKEANPANYERLMRSTKAPSTRTGADILDKIGDDDFDKREKGSRELRLFLGRLAVGQDPAGLSAVMNASTEATRRENPEVWHRTNKELDKLWDWAFGDETGLRLAGLHRHTNKDVRDWVDRKIDKALEIPVYLPRLAAYASQIDQKLATRVGEAARAKEPAVEDSTSMRDKLVDIHEAHTAFVLRDHDTSKLPPVMRAAAIAATRTAARSLTEGADKVAATPEGELARLMYPNNVRTVLSMRHASALSNEPAAAHMSVAWKFAEMAKPLKDIDPAQARELQQEAILHLKEALDRTPDYRNQTEYRKLHQRLREIDVDNYCKLIVIPLRRWVR